jgi:hypothetical protein
MEEIMLDNRTQFNIFTMVKTLHNSIYLPWLKHFTIVHKKKFSLKLTITVLKTDLKCRQKYKILCFHSGDCSDCGILSCKPDLAFTADHGNKLLT